MTHFLHSQIHVVGGGRYLTAVFVPLLLFHTEYSLLECIFQYAVIVLFLFPLMH